ncbi:MAG: TIM barrel protein [Actinobacteria bacterium]|nr:TIM barrel protein [Actinomycetota bacterium]
MRLDLYQSWWGMLGESLAPPPGGVEAGVAGIRDAGFDGVMVFHPLLEAVGPDEWRTLAEGHGLKLGAGTFAATAEGFARDAEDACRAGASWINAQICDVEARGEAALDLLREFHSAAAAAGLELVVETHRGTLTQDLLRTLDYLEALPEMRITVDLSHYVVAGQLEMVNHPEDEFPELFERSFERLAEAAACVHGRISNGNQVQVPVWGPGEYLPSAHFARWWRKTMRSWRRRSAPGQALPFVCELGPPPYAMTTPDACGDKVELSDRWADALALRDLARACWKETENEEEGG